MLVDIPHDKMEAFKDEFTAFIETNYPAIISEIENYKQMTDELKASILNAVKEFKNRQALK